MFIIAPRDGEIGRALFHQIDSCLRSLAPGLHNKIPA